MYNKSMKREKIKKLLTKYYSQDMTNSILIGRRKPNLEVISEAHEKLKIPVKAWIDIRNYLNS